MDHEPLPMSRQKVGPEPDMGKYEMPGHTFPESGTGPGSGGRDQNVHTGFGELAKQWWDKTGPLAALHSMNKLRVPWIVRTVNSARDTPKMEKGSLYLPLEGVKILDVGCGAGILSEPLARLDAQVTGVDEEQLAIDVAQERAIGEGLDIKYVNSAIDFSKNFETLDLASDSGGNAVEKFDAVIASEVIEHVRDQHAFCEQLARLLAPGGHLFLTTLNRTWVAQFLGIYVAENVGIVPKGIHDWNLFISPSDLESMLVSVGLRTELVHGMMYNPLVNEWSWSSYSWINYALHAVK